MKQILILSGKGGTGKTTIASALIKLTEAKAFADCDVDAPNLHLTMEEMPRPVLKDYYGMDKAKIDLNLCNECDLCRIHCRFKAISVKEHYEVDYFACEGCSLCEVVCPEKAISMVPAIAGELMLYQNEAVFSTARLKMGSGNSGLLVTEVKNQLKEAATETDFAIIDGSPGIGCPVIASLNGAGLVLIVTEPSLSGISDLERIVKMASRFPTKIAICINKYDTNLDNTNKIKEFAQKQNLPIVGLIPYDEVAVQGINEGKTIVEVDCKAGVAVSQMKNTLNLL